MLYIKKISIVFALFLGVFTLFAQPVVPGLRGKRLSVEANMACLPLLVRGPTAENAGWANYNPTGNAPYGFVVVAIHQAQD